MSASQVSDFRRRRKANLVKVCGNKCCLCGYHKSIAALEFHHLDPLQKNYGIASSGTCHNLEKDLAEVKKCILVCANCHREIHNGEYQDIDLSQYQIFDEIIAQNLRDEHSKKECVCVKCGKMISAGSRMCPECYKISIRKIDRPSKEELKEKIYNQSFLAIGSEYGVSDNTIRKWCKAYSLPSKKTEIKSYTLEEWSKI